MVEYIKYVRNREYMSGVERDKLRIKQTAEIFTPTPLVQEMLDKLEEENPTLFLDPTNTYLDNSCGDGQFLVGIKNKNVCASNIYGIDLTQSNVDTSIKRIEGHTSNIICADSLGPIFTSAPVTLKLKIQELFE